MVQGDFNRNRLWHFCNIDLKLNGFDIIQTKKAEKKQMLSSVHAVCIQLRELHRLKIITIALFSKSFFFLCGATSQPRIKRTSQSIGKKVSLIIFFFPFRQQSTLRLFLLSPLAKIQFLCFIYSVADFCYNVHC